MRSSGSVLKVYERKVRRRNAAANKGAQGGTRRREIAIAQELAFHFTFCSPCACVRDNEYISFGTKASCSTLLLCKGSGVSHGARGAQDLSGIQGRRLRLADMARISESTDGLEGIDDLECLKCRDALHG